MTIAVILKIWNEEALISLCLNQFRNAGIDTLYLYDDGCTDRTVDVALSLDLPYRLQVIPVSDPHDEYFPVKQQKDEPGLLNWMIDWAGLHDWIIHVDADEVFSPGLIKNVMDLNDLPRDIVGIYVPYMHLVDDLSRYIITMPGVSYPLYPDKHMRIFRPFAWRFPDTGQLDAVISQTLPGTIWQTLNPVIHLHYLDANRRGRRGGRPDNEDGLKQAAFRQPGCTYGTVPDKFIPDELRQWYQNRPAIW